MGVGLAPTCELVQRLVVPEPDRPDGVAHDERFVVPMQDIFGGDDVRLFTEKLNLKRAGHGGPNPLHQDHPYWVGQATNPDRVATALLYLDDATEENGCLWVVPGSHRGGPRKRRTDRDTFGNTEMESDPATVEALVAVPDLTGTVLRWHAG
jgi:ectoine hydroxylase-related dioxygenase (phytanoyl-CoA dioxygenase family)